MNDAITNIEYYFQYPIIFCMCELYMTILVCKLIKKLYCYTYDTYILLSVIEVIKIS